MRLSVFIVSRGRLTYLKGCCESVAKALPDDSEVVVVINGVCPGVAEFLADFNHPKFRWAQIPRESSSSVRNRAFAECRGEVVYFLDDDVIVPEGIFEAALRVFDDDPAVAVVGGVNLTPPLSPILETCFGAVMTSWFAAPMIRQRYFAPTAETLPANQHNIILCNLACRRSVVTKEFYFPEGLVCNQENLFVYLLNSAGAKAVLSRDVYLYHYRRKTLRAFFEQTASYGCGRFQQTCVEWRSCHVLYLAPPAALLCFAGLLLTGQFSLLMSLVGLYAALALIAAVSSETVRVLGILPIISIIPLTALVHLAYGYGWLRGIWALAWRQFRGQRQASPELLLGRW